MTVLAPDAELPYWAITPPAADVVRTHGTSSAIGAGAKVGPFAYLRPGLDTMVAWPDHVDDVRNTRDLRLRNPYPVPVLIRSAVIARDGGPSTLRIELYGAARPWRVDYSFEEVGSEAAEALRRVDASLAPGQSRVQQEALDGLVILRRRTIYTPTRRIEEVALWRPESGGALEGTPNKFVFSKGTG